MRALQKQVSMPKLFIHIGTHKTGTTAIQNTLKESQSKLEREGIKYFQIPKALLALWRSKALDENEIHEGRNFLKRTTKKRRENDFGALTGTRNLSVGNVNKPTNQGYSRDALGIARLVNPQINDDDKREFRQLLQRTHTKQPFDNQAFFTWGERKAILSRYSESSSIVAKEYFSESVKSLFPPPELDSNYEEYQGLTFEKTARILTKTILFTQENNGLDSLSGDHKEPNIESAGLALTRAALFTQQNHGSVFAIASSRF